MKHLVTLRKNYPEGPIVVDDELPFNVDTSAFLAHRSVDPFATAARQIAKREPSVVDRDGAGVVLVEPLQFKSEKRGTGRAGCLEVEGQLPAPYSRPNLGLAHRSAGRRDAHRCLDSGDGLVGEKGHAGNRSGWVALGGLAMALGIAVAALAPAIAQGRALAACVLGLAGVAAFVKSGVLK